MEIEAVGLPAVAQVADPVSADAEIEKSISNFGLSARKFDATNSG